jgi:hypothetical protein
LDGHHLSQGLVAPDRLAASLNRGPNLYDGRAGELQAGVLSLSVQRAMSQESLIEGDLR